MERGQKKGLAVSAQQRATTSPSLCNATAGPTSFLGLLGMEKLLQPEVSKVLGSIRVIFLLGTQHHIGTFMNIFYPKEWHPKLLECFLQTAFSAMPVTRSFQFSLRPAASWWYGMWYHLGWSWVDWCTSFIVKWVPDHMLHCVGFHTCGSSIL